ncbi:MAG TPA: N-acetyltransferase [Corynebacterium xerosis]|uniref:GNAT family N-acetyltransferase n=1 Tax=Corynebacterium xerosis TaxID=1725 RepID=UPI001C3A97E7|nr:GNAT family N-acetyltransferase [Corynebacterium xerosis]HIW68435.1 N-acetyltransferase [Candidatus Dietzia merdigallinarum]HJG56147.1 N-acetyltransferase [Corynebacterium xerosis]
MAHTIDHDEAAHRYVLIVDGQEAGFAAYEPAEGALDFNHTVVHEQFQGQGLSKPLVQAALDDVRHNGGKIIPTCSAVERFISKNPDYADLVA